MPLLNQQWHKLSTKIIFLSRTYYVSNKLQNYKNKIILGIETSCDDTGCAIINGTGKILGESLYSQNAIHLKYGGVNPMFAYELHRENIDSCVKDALSSASMSVENIDAVAVTTKPGLLVSLQVGVKYAKHIGRKFKKPLIPIHHMEAYALVARMYYDIPFPFIVLLISGGHCLLAVVQGVNDFLLLGKSFDNAPGEVLDKVARRMKLKNIPAYSQMAGGQAVECAAKNATTSKLFNFTMPLLQNHDCNFSLSGIQNSLQRKLLVMQKKHGIIGDEIIPEVNELCASFQNAIAKHLAHRTERAILFCEKFKLINSSSQNLVVSGGVACNDFIFKCIESVGMNHNYRVLRPPPKVCTDNGAMIAWNGLEKLIQSQFKSDIDLNEIDPNAPLGRSLIQDVQAANLQVKASRLKKLLNNC